MKKLLSLVLCVAMLLSCGIFAMAEENSDLRTVSLLSRREFNAEWHTDEIDDNLCVQYFYDQLAQRGIKLEIEVIDNASIGTTIQTRMAAATDLPDVISDVWTGVSDTEIINWGKNGLLVNLYDALEQYDDDGSILEYYKTRCPSALGANTCDDGALYWFSYLANTQYMDDNGNMIKDGDISSPHLLSLRTDWLEKADVEYKFFYTPDELFDALLAIQAADPNGNGAKDETVAVDIAGFKNGIAQGFGLGKDYFNNIDNATGKVFNNFEAEGFVDYITFMQKLYENGLYDTSALNEGMIDQLIADNKAVAGYNYATWTSWEATIADENAEYAAIIIDDAAGENGYTVIGDPSSATYCHYMVTKDCKDLEAVIDLFDYVYTDEYALLDIWGLEGISFEYAENGIPKALESYGREAEKLFVTLGLNALPAVNIGTQMVDDVVFQAVPSFPVKDSFRHFWFYDRSMIDKADIINNKGEWALPTEEEIEALDDLENDLETYASELLVGLITGKKDMANLDSYIEELKAIGMDDYTAVWQARHDRYLAAANA